MAESALPAPNGERRIGIVFFAVVLLALALLVALGSWQVRRLHWKKGLVAAIEQRLQTSPVPLDTALSQWSKTDDVDYLPVHLEGTFRHGDEQHFLATYNGQSGWYVYTPLDLDDGRTVIVNRGFVSYDLKQASSRPWTPIGGTTGFRGLARNPLYRKPGWLLPENAPSDRIWYWKDLSAMPIAMGLDTRRLVPFFVDLAAYDDPALEGPVGGVTRVALSNRHLQYAVTWFGLAAALASVAGFVVWRDWRHRKR